MEAKNLIIDKLTKKIAAAEQHKHYHMSVGDYGKALAATILIRLYQRRLDELTNEGAAV